MNRRVSDKIKSMKIDEIRKDFPILERKINGSNLVYLDNAATTQKPEKVIEAVGDFYRLHNANVHRGIHTLSDEATGLVEDSREKVGRFIGALSSREIVFVRNASEGINVVMNSWGKENVNKGDVVLITKMEHHSNLVPWQMLCKRKEAVLRVVSVDDEGRLVWEGKKREVEEGVEEGGLMELLDEKVKLVAINHASNVTGVVNPVEKVIEEVKKRSAAAKILVDASQSVPHMLVDVGRMGADFVVFSGHKMLGPTGVGVLWGKEEVLKRMPPFLYGGDMISEVKLDCTRFNKLPWKFEAGTPNMAGIVGLGAAIDYLSDIGMNEVWAHGQELVEYSLRKIMPLVDEGLVKIYGPTSMEERGAVIAFNIEGVHAHDTAQVLDNQGVAVRSGQHCAAPLVEGLGEKAVSRASFYLYNNRADVDSWIEGLSKVKEVVKIC